MSLKRITDSIDWDDIRQRLEQSRQAMENLTEPDSVRQQQILRERAVTLAQVAAPSAPVEPLGDCIDVLAFRAAGERYAVETVHVAQVYPMLSITAIPGVPDFVVGIVAVKGDVLSVIDLRSLLDLPLARLEEPSAIIVLQSESMEFGILAEDILGVERYVLQTLERTLPTLGNIEQTYLKGVAPNRTAILDADWLLSDPKLVIEAA
ncbi:MAG TPA: chemotaxis protein CheW [Noviherbaspirillum sp.]|nr:chemotaxis protein CheW [Noviherbaspirillum sp.]